MAITFRKYAKSDVISFAKTTAKYGSLSNMAPRYPLFVNEVFIHSSENLYQACKFPLHPQIQREIIEQRNPMIAKEISRKFEMYVRPDWEDIKYKVMEWCISVKLIQNWDTFAEVLLSTGDKPIVEYSAKDNTWGAMPDGDFLVGKNALGRLLMQVRANYILNKKQHYKLLPPDVAGFLLFDYPIGTVYGQDFYKKEYYGNDNKF